MLWGTCRPPNAMQQDMLSERNDAETVARAMLHLADAYRDSAFQEDAPFSLSKWESHLRRV